MVVLFVGNERPGTVSIYSITDDLYNPNFESIYSGIADKNGTWEDLFNRRQLSEVDPEDIRYQYNRNLHGSRRTNEILGSSVFCWTCTIQSFCSKHCHCYVN